MNTLVSRTSRRHLLRGAGATVLGAAALAAGCGDDDDEVGGPSSTAPAGQSSTAPASAPASATPVMGGTLKVPVYSPAVDFDPHPRVQPYPNSLWRAVSSGLFAVNPSTAQVEGELAKEWSFPDELTLVIKLQPNAKWHNKAPVNGRPVTAADIKFSMERITTKTYTRSSDYQSVDRFEAIDANTFRIVLKSTYAPLVSLMTDWQVVMVAPEVVQQFGDLKKPESLIGCGPFLPEKVDGTTGARLVRNADYWQAGRPYLDAVEWAIVNDPQTALAAFRSGDFHAFYIAAIDVPTLRGSGDITIEHVLGLKNRHDGIAGDVTKGRFSDPRIRQAMSLALDRDAIGKASYPGADAYKVGGIFGNPRWGLTPEEIAKRPGFRTPKDPDIAEAKKMIDAAGGNVSFKLTTTSGFPNLFVDRAQAMKAQLDKIGVTLNLDVQEYTAFRENEPKKNFELYTQASGVSGDPDAAVVQVYFSDGARNYINYNNPEIERLVKATRNVFDESKRVEMLLDVQRKLLDESPLIYDTFFEYVDVGVRKNVKGLGLKNITGTGSNIGDQGYQFKNVWLAKT